MRNPHRALGRAAALVVAATLSLVVSACAPTGARTTGTSDGAGVVGIALPSASDAQWSRGGDALVAELRERGYSVDLQYAAGDARTQGSQVQNMLTKGADALIVAPLSVDDLDAPLRAAAAEAVPVVAIERALGLPGLGFAAAVDPEAMGRAQAQAALSDAVGGARAGDETAPTPDDARAGDETAPTPGDAPDAPAPDGIARIAIVGGAADDVWTRRRYDAVVETLAPAVQDGKVTIVSGGSYADAAVDGDGESAAEDRARALFHGDAGIGPTAVVAISDAATRGVVAALSAPDPGEETPSPTPGTDTASPTPDDSATAAPDLEDTLDERPVVIGAGADPVTVQALHDGLLDATVFVDPRALVDWTADAVEALLNGAPPRVDGSSPAGLDGIPTATVSASVVRAGDIDGLLVETGWLSADDLD